MPGTAVAEEEEEAGAGTERGGAMPAVPAMPKPMLPPRHQLRNCRPSSLSSGWLQLVAERSGGGSGSFGMVGPAGSSKEEEA